MPPESPPRTDQAALDRLRAKRRRLMQAYVLHVGWFASTCAFAATDAMQIALSTAILMTLITVPPVLIYTVFVHRACRTIDPSAPTAGPVTVVIATVLLTPFESGLVLPARNLWIASKLLRHAQGPPRRPA